MHICIGKPAIIGSDYGLSPGWGQAIIWTKAGVLLIGLLETNVCEISYVFMQENAFENAVCETVSTLSQPQYVNNMQLKFVWY